MHDGRRLFLLVSDSAAARLRDESGCRALRDGSVEFVSWDALRDWSLIDADIQTSPEAIAPLLAAIASGTPSLFVAVCVAREAGEVARYYEEVARVSRWLERRMQADRLPAPTVAQIVVAERGLDATDEAALTAAAGAACCAADEAALPPANESDSSAAQELRALFPRGTPVYLMAGASRVDRSGVAWASRDVWPIAVGTLLGSLHARPSRSPGLRAWRTIAVDSRNSSVEDIDAEAAAMVNEALAFSDQDDGRRVVSAFPHRPLPAPSDRVADQPIPGHCEHVGGDPDTDRPSLPEFCEIRPTASYEPGHGLDCGAYAHTEDRLDSEPKSRWAARWRARGATFVADRTSRLKAATITLSGPRSPVSTVWSNIQQSPRLLRWYASGGFFRPPDVGEFELLTTQMRRWRGIARQDELAVESHGCALAEARELDLARAHYMGLPGRLVCALCAAGFATAAFCVPAQALGAGVVIAAALCAGAAAGLTAAVLVYLELAAGARSRKSAERASCSAEREISETFAKRLTLGADGELMQRSLAWLQNAARVREAAKRVLDLRQAAIGRLRSGGLTSRDAETLQRLKAFREASTVLMDGGVEASTIASLVRQANPTIISEQADRLELDWRNALEALDPSCVGGIAKHEFVPRLERILGSARDSLRDTLLDECERAGLSSWIRASKNDFAGRFGRGTDFGALSVSTLRARGHDLQRVTHVICAHESAADLISDAVRECAQGTLRPVITYARTDAWSAYALVIDEIAIHFPIRSEVGELTTRFLEGVRNDRVRGERGAP
jgi:hypothetical protein